MTCRQCGTDIADKALICYRCGTATTAPRVKPPSAASLFERPRGRWLSTVVVLVTIIVALAVAWLFSG